MDLQVPLRKSFTSKLKKRIKKGKQNEDEYFLIIMSLCLFFLNMPILVQGKTLNSNIEPEVVETLGEMIGGLEHCREILGTNTPDKPIEKYFEEITGLHQLFSSNEGYI